MSLVNCLQVAFAAVLGAGMSIGVALGLAMRPHSENSDTAWIYRPQDDQRQSDVYCVERSRQWGRVSLDVMLSGSGANWCFGHPDPGEPEDLVSWWAWPEVKRRAASGGWFDAYACGWPAPCLWGASAPWDEEQSAVAAPEWCYQWFGVEEVLLPRRVIWSGLALNTTLYGSAAWLAVFGPWRLRRTIRQRRMLCLYCGYDLRGLRDAGCPECGAGRGKDDNAAGRRSQAE